MAGLVSHHESEICVFGLRSVGGKQGSIGDAIHDFKNVSIGFRNGISY